MKILVAPNAMKGSLSAFDFANAIEEGLKKAGLDDITKIPVADGGDDTALVLATVLNAEFITCNVHDPLMRKIESGFYLTDDKVAIVDMASASGLKLLEPSEYNPRQTSSFGTGELIKCAIEKGAKSILLGVGGSATVDAGMGALMALEFRFYWAGDTIEHGCGDQLGNVTYIDTSFVDSTILETPITILADVKNPLLGHNGAATVFGPQKGASELDVTILEKNLSMFAGAVYQTTGLDVSILESGGAAGGITASFQAFLNAEVVDGADFVLQKSNFYAKAANSDIIVTGEGIIDETSFSGKATGLIFNFGTVIDKTVYAICGNTYLDKNKFLNNIHCLLTDDCGVDYTIANAYSLVVEKAVVLGKKIKNV